MDPKIAIYYLVNSIVRVFNWTRKDCSQMKTVGYNGLINGFVHLAN